MTDKRVLDIGNCSSDHRAIATLVSQHFNAQVVRARNWQEAQDHLRAVPFDLVLVNRKLDVDGSDGLEVVRHIKQHAGFQAVPTMLVTNFPDVQQQAVEAGAVEGFGKGSLCKPETVERLRPFLS
jgi:CheY-like chemotaxis protein